MSRNRGLIIGFVAAALAFGVVAGPAGAQGDGEPVDSKSEGVIEEYFVVQSSSGSVVEAGDAFTLTLDDVDRNAIVFTDRPTRDAGAMPVKHLVKHWEKLGLADDPPNAAISVIDGKGRGTASTYTLTDPKLDGKELSFTATPLNDISSDPAVASAIQEHVTAATGEIPEKFGSSTLFIDPGTEGITQSCQAIVTNNSGTVVAGVIGAVLPIPPATVIPNGSAGVVKTSNVIGCTLGVVFTTGARKWTISQSAVTGQKNTYTASDNVKVTPGNVNSATWIVQYTLNP